MCSYEINGNHRDDGYDYAYAYKAYRFLIPAMYLIGAAGRWISCCVWHRLCFFL